MFSLLYGTITWHNCQEMYVYSASVGKCFHLYDLNRNIYSGYGSLSEECGKYGATLVRVDSQEKQDAVEEYLGNFMYYTW